MQKNILLAMIIALLGGCATSVAVTSALPIKVVPESAVASCEFLQQIFVNKTNMLNSVNAKIQQAQYEAAQQALTLGADTMTINDTDITGNGHVVNISVSAYKCIN